MRYISVKYPFMAIAFLSIILFWGNGRAVLAQSPADYFVGSANFYIDGETERAKAYVESGLSKYPDDKKLQALKKAIEEEEKDKNKNKEKEDQQDQNKDQQNNKDQQQQQQKDGYISKEDAQRLLDALANDEKNVQEKVKEEKAAKARVRTLINW